MKFLHEHFALLQLNVLFLDLYMQMTRLANLFACKTSVFICPDIQYVLLCKCRELC